MIVSRALRGFAQRRLVEQDAARWLGAAPDAPAQLVQLRQAEALGMLDHHDRGVRHVDADLDHRRRDQQPRAPALEGVHRLVLFGSAHAPMHQPDLVAEPVGKIAEAVFRGGGVDLLAFLDQRADPIELLAALAVRGRHAPINSSIRDSGIAVVRIGWRPAGLPVSFDTSMSPK